MSEEDLIKLTEIRQIDFLKCDIEGSEFGLLHEGSKLLQITSQLAIELHTNVGDAKQFEMMLRRTGFETKIVHVIGQTVLLTARRDPGPTTA